MRRLEDALGVAYPSITPHVARQYGQRDISLLPTLIHRNEATSLRKHKSHLSVIKMTRRNSLSGTAWSFLNQLSFFVLFVSLVITVYLQHTHTPIDASEVLSLIILVTLKEQHKQYL